MDQPLNSLDEKELKAVDNAIYLGLVYYADPGNYFALDIRKTKDAGDERGDFWNDYGDEITGPYASSIKPGELARSAFNKMQAMRDHPQVNWNEMEVPIPWHRYDIINLDLDERSDALAAEREAQYARQKEEEKLRQAALPDFEKYDCCHMTSEYAQHVEFSLIEDPKGRLGKDGTAELVMPQECPLCQAPTENRDNYQPNTQSYICGAIAYKCGHLGHKSGDSALCDYYQEISK